MPQKPLKERIKRAKRQGTAYAVKETDLQPDSEKSHHSPKKSRGIAGAGLPPDRRAGMKSPPSQGRNRAGAEPDFTQRTVERGAEIQTPHEIPVRGRKKPPSQVHIRRPGG